MGLWANRAVQGWGKQVDDVIYIALIFAGFGFGWLMILVFQRL
jgi:hypothetical protein